MRSPPSKYGHARERSNRGPGTDRQARPRDRLDEVAAMITYVCSARASATTGAALRIDGGVVRAIA
jgi:NAD(P)-dependent dehydrogenase (short-subunit alcohol dehydrogenase family)